MSAGPTWALYLRDPYLDRCESHVVGSGVGWVVLDRTVFYPGGGGQPADRGTIVAHHGEFPVESVDRDESGAIRHHVADGYLALGVSVECRIDWPLRYALMRHHALMHVVNAVALRDFGGLITGVLLGPDRSRVDFRFPSFARGDLDAMAAAVDAILAGDAVISASEVTEEEFRARPDLVRTLNVAPPVVGGMVRVVEISGIDAQACGGTHVHRLAEVGEARIVGYENKGRQNKRVYWTLGPPPVPAVPHPSSQVS